MNTERDIGRLEAVAEALEKEVAALRKDVAELKDLVAQAKGGSKVVFLLGSITGGGIGALIMKLLPFTVR